MGFWQRQSKNAQQKENFGKEKLNGRKERFGM
jgi:hypothetical protein